VGNIAKFYHITRGNEQEGLYDVSKDYRKGTHPAEATEIKEKCKRMEYMIEVYTDGSKSENGVGSVIAIWHASVKWVHKPLIIYYGNVNY